LEFSEWVIAISSLIRRAHQDFIIEL